MIWTFKVAGTEKVLLLCKMDIKIEGISKPIMQVALQQAREGSDAYSRFDEKCITIS